jgi:hypothetical protein
MNEPGCGGRVAPACRRSMAWTPRSGARRRGTDSWRATTSHPAQGVAPRYAGLSGGCVRVSTKERRKALLSRPPGHDTMETGGVHTAKAGCWGRHAGLCGEVSGLTNACTGRVSAVAHCTYSLASCFVVHQRSVPVVRGGHTPVMRGVSTLL